MIGRNICHYRITAKIGEGGMGEVYRAKDTKLGRDVAIKLLQRDIPSTPEQLERFQREARAVAALNHPNIVTIHSVEEAEGLHFLTMELVEGKSLGHIIPSEGFDSETFFELAFPLVEAISAAHERGITHRDLKPANVMIGAERRLKVLDFGLAKLHQPESDSILSELPTEAKTREGIIVGTIPYMSPEQIEGKTADRRTDIFALGILLYEMATGERPFKGKTAPALMSAILKDTPLSITEQRPDLPSALQEVIGRCLAKIPDERYSSARHLLEELRASRETPPSSAASDNSKTSARGFWVAVLPFKHRGTDSDVEALAEGLSEDITTGLSKFSYLRVISRNSASRYRGQAADIRHVGKELGARYIMEGGIRQVGTRVRINIQLLDTLTGTHLWAETFDRNLETADIFAVQDEITDRTVATVADPFGVLARSMATPTDGRSPEDLTPYESVLRFFLYQHRVAPHDHQLTRTALEHAVKLEPRYADAWACLAILYLDEERHEFNRRPQALDRALEAARRAVDAEPANQLTNYALAQAYYYRRDLGAFRATAERAIRLNLRDGNTIAMLGLLIAYAGDWDRGVQIAARAMKLNPHHPGWYHFAEAFDYYRKGKYAESLASAQKINMPDYFSSHMVLAAAHAQVGNTDAARAEARETVKLYPDFERRARQEHLDKWFFAQPLLVEHVVEGLRKAGLNVAHSKEGVEAKLLWGSSLISQEKQESIAVMPFQDMSSARDQDWFCEGMAEEIINALSHLEGIRVAARTSAFSFKGKGQDIRGVGKALSVNKVLEGSVRVAGKRLRVTTQLINVADGYQLWSERYDREMEDVFAIQDEIATRVVEALEVKLSSKSPASRPLPRSGDIETYQLYLKGRYHRYTKNDVVGALAYFEQVVERDPSFVRGRAGLAEVYALSGFYGSLPAREAFTRAKAEVDTALHIQGDSSEALAVDGFLWLFYERDWNRAERSLARALELNAEHVQANAWYAFLLDILARREEAIKWLKHCQDLDPLSPYPPAITGLFHLNARDVEPAVAAFEESRKIDPDNLMGLWGFGLTLTSVGRFDEAIALLAQSVECSGRATFFLSLLGWAFAKAGRVVDAERILEEVKDRFARESPTIGVVWLLAELGEREQAWDLLRRVEEERQPTAIMTGLPGFDCFRRDARFTALCQRMNLLA